MERQSYYAGVALFKICPCWPQRHL